MLRSFPAQGTWGNNRCLTDAPASGENFLPELRQEGGGTLLGCQRRSGVGFTVTRPVLGFERFATWRLFPALSEQL